VIKFYKHRGLRVDALATVTEHESAESILRYIRSYFAPALNADSFIKLVPLDYQDSDYTHEVLLNNKTIMGFAHV